MGPEKIQDIAGFRSDFLGLNLGTFSVEVQQSYRLDRHYHIGSVASI